MTELRRRKLTRRSFAWLAGAGSAAALGGFASGASAAAPRAEPAAAPSWDLTADVVVIGSGASGLPAAIRAADAGASVIVVEANYEVGGHFLLSDGSIALGGGTSIQKKYGIADSPETLFQDLTDWSVVTTGGSPDYRYNDRGVQRALADNEAGAYEFLVANGVTFPERAPDVTPGANAVGLSAPRENHTFWIKGISAESPSGLGGTTLSRSLEVSARKKGVRFLLNYHMDEIVRQSPHAGRVLGIRASYSPTIMPGATAPLKSFHSEGNIDRTSMTVSVRARRAVMLGTGGSSGNVLFRRMFDPRLTEEYATAGNEFSRQDASGEKAAMAIGATLWGTANQTLDRNAALRYKPLIGTRTNYVYWTPDSPIFPRVRATGVHLTDWQNVIVVNQVGTRFYNEVENTYPFGTHMGALEPYLHGDWRNPDRIEYHPQNFLDAALAINDGSTAPEYAAGPQWAIFDSETVRREKWNLAPPATHPDFFFSAGTLAELAAQMTKCPYQKVEMPGANLEKTVERYNALVELGVDVDFAKPTPKYKFLKPPFYAAWASVMAHDTYAGLRINMKCQVMDTEGQVIPGLYCGGESAAGCSQHGMGKCVTQGYIAGREAALESVLPA